MNNREAIALLRNLEDALDSYCELNEEGKTAFRMAIEALNCSEIPNNWIPCSERLPEDWVSVLVTLKRPERLPAWIKAKPENYFHIVDADVCENGEWSVNKKNVTAWMPLPEPYQPKEDES